jgi:hypothetical protein
MSAIPYISNRFALKRFLGMTEEELAENERLWKEENDEQLTPIPTDAAGEMRTAGISGAGIGADMGGMEDEDLEADVPPIDGGAATPPDTATGGAPGGGAPGGGTPPPA